MTSAPFPALPLLIVDDDEDVQRSYAAVLRHQGLTNIVACTDSREVMTLLARQEYELVLLDLNMPHLSGRDLLPKIVRQYPDLPVIVVTGVDDVRTAVTAMKEGARDYFVKPVDSTTLVNGIRRAMELSEIRRENALLKRHLLSPRLLHPEAFAEIITGNREMLALFQYVEAVAGTQQPILITGETGVGKELLARAIHRLSGRRGDFVPVNIAGLDDNLFSDTLFGHLRGAFTGATEPRRGLIEQAEDGTLFLDEIGELSPPSQVKLLRLLQEREYFPLGADVPKYANTRIVVATNRRLEDLRDSPSFRDDLFYRLRTHHVAIPPLRERLDDLPLLVAHFVKRAAASLGKRVPPVPRELFVLLRNYHFPGNVRELEGMVYNAVSVHTTGMLSLKTFEKSVGVSSGRSNAKRSRTEDRALWLPPPMYPLPTMNEARQMLIEEALRRTDGNHTLAAKLLGITRQTMHRHLKPSAPGSKRHTSP